MSVPFYDALAPYYDVLFPDWDASMQRQGDAISFLLVTEGRPVPSSEFRILDAAAGIGTQALPLAARGHPVVARDLSPAAIDRRPRNCDVFWCSVRREGVPLPD